MKAAPTTAAGDRSRSSGGAPDVATLLAFAVLVVLGGSNPVAVRISNLEIPPFWGAAMRILIASVMFWALLAVRRAPLPSGRALVACLVYGILGVGVFFGLVYWGLVRIQAGLAMIVLALSPLLTMFLAAAHGIERIRWRGVVGALAALGGIAIAVGLEAGLTVPVGPFLALLVAAASVAEGSIAFKLVPPPDPLATNAIATGSGGVLLLLLSLVLGESWVLPATTTTWIALAYLIVVGTAAVFAIYLFVLSRWTASGASYSFLTYPIATALIAAWVAQEPVTPRLVLGGSIVLIGVWIGAFSDSDPSRPSGARVDGETARARGGSS